jgi:hypothetical protein
MNDLAFQLKDRIAGAGGLINSDSGDLNTEM